MITNIPTSDSLDDVALRLYFSAWGHLITILRDFDLAFEPGHDPSVSGWNEERAEYLAACQPELQSVCTLIQQSNELALKARICKVSPFLLLLRSDGKLSTITKNVDFSEFRTLDAVELPAAVNTFCQEALSEQFIQTYNDIRQLRNKIAHLGHPAQIFEPNELLHTLVFQYTELWKHRAWLQDRVEFLSQTRASFFHDGRYTSPHMEVMHELPLTLDILSPSEFRQLFGCAKSKRRYLCHSCIDQGRTKYADLDMDVCKTAILDDTHSSINCLMCGENFRISRSKCTEENCKGTVIGDNDDAYVGMCHTCGEMPT